MNRLRAVELTPRQDFRRRLALLWLGFAYGLILGTRIERGRRS